MSKPKEVRVGSVFHTLARNLRHARVRIGQIAVLPDGTKYLRIDARKNPDRSAWTLVREE